MQRARGQALCKIGKRTAQSLRVLPAAENNVAAFIQIIKTVDSIVADRPTELHVMSCRGMSKDIRELKDVLPASPGIVIGRPEICEAPSSRNQPAAKAYVRDIAQIQRRIGGPAGIQAIRSRLSCLLVVAQVCDSRIPKSKFVERSRSEDLCV